MTKSRHIAHNSLDHPHCARSCCAQRVPIEHAEYLHQRGALQSPP
jgi:hypothetical protein